ncbi:MAG: 30S ribosomal protein S17 [Deltaproteobacteria bacterium]|nr:30S ribosomal protein S17 [Deltaproteobacteria bacterium]
MTERGLRKKMTGTVVSNKMQKTAVVLVERLTKHGTYGKFFKRHAKYMVHDPQGVCQVGDKVRIIESRPISREKRWQMVEVLTKGMGQD